MLKCLQKFKKLLTVALIVIVAVCFSACGSSPEDKAKDAVDSGFKALKDNNYDEVEKYIADFDSDVLTKGMEGFSKEQTKEFFNSFFLNFDYKIKDAKKKDDETVIVTVEVTNTDMKKVSEKWQKKIMSIAMENLDKSEKELMKLALKEFTKEVKESKDTVTNEINLKVKKGKDNWQLKPTDEQINKIMGGFPGN